MSWRSVYYPAGTHFLDKDDIHFIAEQLKLFPLEYITVGDAGEVNNCSVGRLVEDHPQSEPCLVNNELSQPILKMISSEKARQFFSTFFNGAMQQTIRRCQFNLLKESAFVGRHLDIDSNPDYLIAAVLQLGSDFTGGEFVVYPSKSADIHQAQIIQPEHGSLTISYCKYEHEVKTVMSGTRTSFVSFVSDYSGPNKRISY